MLISRADRGVIARWWFTVDRPLLGAVFVLMATGVLASMAASPPVALRLGLPYFHFFFYQVAYLIPSVVVLIATSMLEPVFLKRLCACGFLIFLGLMGVALFFGPEIKGAHRWISFGPFNLQPSEFAKPMFVISAAWCLGLSSNATKEHASVGFLSIGFALACGLYGVFIFLLMQQPDFGQATLVSLVFFCLLFVFGLPWRWLLGFGVSGLVLGIVAFLTLPHVQSRLMRFFNPNVGDHFQIETAMQAISNGGFFGVGPGGGSAKTILPDAHTDFIVAVIAEEFGTIACMILMGLFLFIILRGLLQAQRERDPFYALGQVGLATIFGFQALINLGVNVSLLPAKGMTLPLISYGGSSLLAMAFGLGLLAAFGRRRPRAYLPGEVE